VQNRQRVANGEGTTLHFDKQDGMCRFSVRISCREHQIHISNVAKSRNTRESPGRCLVVQPMGKFATIIPSSSPREFIIILVFEQVTRHHILKRRVYVCFLHGKFARHGWMIPCIFNERLLVVCNHTSSWMMLGLWRF